MHDSNEEDGVVAHIEAISAKEARVRFRWEEVDSVRQMREYETRVGTRASAASSSR
jgi:hypothetical protein